MFYDLFAVLLLRLRHHCNKYTPEEQTLLYLHFMIRFMYDLPRPRNEIVHFIWK